MSSLQHRSIRSTIGTFTGHFRKQEYNIAEVRRAVDLGSLIFFMPWSVLTECVRIGHIPAEWIIPQNAGRDKVVVGLNQKSLWALKCA